MLQSAKASGQEAFSVKDQNRNRPVLLQSALLQQVVDGAAFAQIGLGHFDHRFGVVGFYAVKSSSTSSCSLLSVIR
jgi:hypothetical protein